MHLANEPLEQHHRGRQTPHLALCDGLQCFYELHLGLLVRSVVDIAHRLPHKRLDSLLMHRSYTLAGEIGNEALCKQDHQEGSRRTCLSWDRRFANKIICSFSSLQSLASYTRSRIAVQAIFVAVMSSARRCCFSRLSRLSRAPLKLPWHAESC